MKQLTKLLLFPLLLTFAWSQVYEQTKPMSQGSHPGLGITLQDVSDKQVEKSWKSYLDKYGKVKKSKGEWVSKGVSIPAIASTGTFDLYATFSESNKNVKFVLWVNLGGEYLSAASSNTDAYTNTQKFLDDFSFKVFKDKVKAELKKENGKLKKIKSEFEKLQGAHDDYVKDIKKAEKKIQKANKEIEENRVKQEKVQKELANQQKIVDEVQARLSALAKK
ncbi:hypothetical protein ACFL46_01175 [Candidatus Neomarinimicrobiota bacterium]